MQDGRLLFAHYAFMPNRLGYCGGNENKELLDYCVDGYADRGLEQLIRKFQAAYPYLEFIAHENGITDPFDRRVVEAYWVGNSLLQGVEAKDFHGFIKDRLGPRVPKRMLTELLGKAPDGARPHHSFHVLDVSIRTGALRESLDDLDRCRISWGVVQRVEGQSLTVLYQPLEFQEGRLTLGEPKERNAFWKSAGYGYLVLPTPGDVVSLHWDWVCDLLTPTQAVALQQETEHHLAIANRTL